MANLSSEQQEMRDSLRKSAMIWGGILGVILALLLVWILSGQGAGVRYGVSAVAGLAAAFAFSNGGSRRTVMPRNVKVAEHPIPSAAPTGRKRSQEPRPRKKPKNRKTGPPRKLPGRKKPLR